MRLSEILKKYRADRNISLDTFAVDSGLSKGYLSMIENERNPKTNKPISPTLDSLKKLAAGMEMDVNELIAIADDMLVDIGSSTVDLVPGTELSPDEIALINLFRCLNQHGKSKALEYLSDLSDNQKYTKAIALSNA